MPARVTTSVPAALVVLSAMLLPTVAAGARPIGLIEDFPAPGRTESLAPGAAGGVWFTFKAPLAATDGYEEGLGHLDADGKAGKVTAGLDPGAVPTTVTAGPEGDVWIDDAGDPPALARIAPDGSITEFPLAAAPGPPAFAADGSIWFAAAGGLYRMDPVGSVTAVAAPGLVSDPTAAADGSVWFLARVGGQSAVGRVDPSGAVGEFTAGIPAGAEAVDPVAGPDGDVWFEVEGGPVADGRLARATPSGEIGVFRGPGQGVRIQGGPIVGGDGAIWFLTTEAPRSGIPWPSTAVGRLGPEGELTPFSRCMAPLPPASGPTAITRGPEGDIWYATVPNHLYRGPAPPGIGRITPDGLITEFRDGLRLRPTSLAADADGTIWVGSDGEDQIARLRPGAEPTNGFRIEGSHEARGRRRGRVKVLVPSAGTVGIASPAGTAPDRRVRPATVPVSCGTAFVPVRPTAALRAAARARRSEVPVTLTYTPAGGTPDVKETQVAVGPPQPR